ncbi:hypothetical protein IQ235_18540, partial [Oscillatoriales cyanobacterium LEGE 11467]|nr:hypothetical protein [Zarconia navalis LEGE 11467]
LGPTDEVNPDYKHPTPQQLAEILTPADWQLMRRLPVYPQYESWSGDALQNSIASWKYHNRHSN